MEMSEHNIGVLELNADCLQQIFQKLNLREQILLAEVCHRFRDVIVEFIFKTQFRIFRTNCEQAQMLSNVEFQKLFNLVAPIIEELTIQDVKHIVLLNSLAGLSKERILSLLGRYNLPNLTILKCYEEDLNDDHIKVIADKCPNVKELHIHSQHVTGMHMQKFRQLSTLHAPKSGFNEDYLSALLPQLSCLNISNASLEPYKMKIKKNKTLKNLDISANLLIDGFALYFKHFSTLQQLRVVADKYIKPSTLLPQQKHYWECFGKYLANHAAEITFKNTKNVRSLLMFQELDLRFLHQVIKYLKKNENGNYFVCAKFLDEPKVHLHILNNTELPDLKDMLNECLFVSDVYLHNVVMDAFSFEFYICGLIAITSNEDDYVTVCNYVEMESDNLESFQSRIETFENEQQQYEEDDAEISLHSNSAFERLFFTLHIVDKQINTPHYKNILEEIVQSDAYRNQYNFGLIFELPSEETNIPFQEYENVINIKLGINESA